jgi:hypothetical protein
VGRMTYAQILGGLVQNTIIIDDPSMVPTFSDGFDYCIRIDTLDPVPGIGWGYDGSNFTPPS